MAHVDSIVYMQELWRTCLGLKPDFKQSYIPFHHFRSKVHSTSEIPIKVDLLKVQKHCLLGRVATMAKVMQGWVVRPGAQYGVDYVLYSKHPAAAHSSYCLLSLMGRKNPSFLSWNDIEAANRNSTQARFLSQHTAAYAGQISL